MMSFNSIVCDELKFFTIINFPILSEFFARILRSEVVQTTEIRFLQQFLFNFLAQIA